MLRRPEVHGPSSTGSTGVSASEAIGPYQIEGGRLWFGNQYYDGEGERGAGYFDTKTHQYVLFSPPQIARWEVTAFLVEFGAIWLALDRFGEDISTSPGGLIHWSRTDRDIRHYPLEFVITQSHRMERNPLYPSLDFRRGHRFTKAAN